MHNIKSFLHFMKSIEKNNQCLFMNDRIWSKIDIEYRYCVMLENKDVIFYKHLDAKTGLCYKFGTDIYKVIFGDLIYRNDWYKVKIKRIYSDELEIYNWVWDQIPKNYQWCRIINGKIGFTKTLNACESVIYLNEVEPSLSGMCISNCNPDTIIKRFEMDNNNWANIQEKYNFIAMDKDLSFHAFISVPTYINDKWVNTDGVKRWLPLYEDIYAPHYNWKQTLSERPKRRSY